MTGGSAARRLLPRLVVTNLNREAIQILGSNITELCSQFDANCTGKRRNLLCLIFGAVLAKFAEICFAHALNAETPFTFGFAKETLRLGILAIAIPLGCAIAGSIVEAIAAAWMNAPKIAILQKNFNSTLSASVGVMFILVSLLCRSGAELLEKNRAEG